VSALRLRELPSLLTDCVIVGHACKANMVFTLRQFFALCIHMLNENPPNFFLIPYRENDQAQYKKAFRVKAADRIAWAWDTITGKAKRPASIGFYPTNSERKTRWAAMDFDAHDGDFMRARDLALNAFGFLYRQPQLFVPNYQRWRPGAFGISSLRFQPRALPVRGLDAVTQAGLRADRRRD
jgi:hypothetical protein